MIQKYTYGTPFETDAIVTSIPASEGTPAYGTISTENGFSFTYDMDDNDVVYGLGESNRGINKRGYVYESNCSDQPNHTEDKISLYGAHNFLVISGKQTFGLFVDYPGKLKFDIGYTLSSQLKITCEDADLYLYVIEGETPYDIVKQFRKIIGRSYIPPKFAFGFGQSRWGYTTADDFRKAADGYRENNIPIDMVYMDIDYMEDYKDFTVNQENFPDFEARPVCSHYSVISHHLSVLDSADRHRYFCHTAMPYPRPDWQADASAHFCIRPRSIRGGAERCGT